MFQYIIRIVMFLMLLVMVACGGNTPAETTPSESVADTSAEAGISTESVEVGSGEGETAVEEAASEEMSEEEATGGEEMREEGRDASSEMVESIDPAEFEEFELFDPNNFDETSIHIDNEWWPLLPGTQFVYEGFTMEEGEETPHQVIFTVTDLTKVINGVNTVVIYDRDYSDGLLEEAELAFFAQDIEGNVWHFGQYRETHNETEFEAGRAWMAGHLEGALGGIMMKAEPKVGAPSYSQGYAPPPYNWTDRARTSAMGETVTVASGTYEDVMVSEEYNAEEPDAFQLKYYARGVGNVKIGWRGDDSSTEEMALMEVIQLEGDELDAIREEALALETRAYVYGSTSEATPRDEMVEDAGENPLNVATVPKTSAALVNEGYAAFDVDNFDETSIHIDNAWWPLQPGRQYVYDGFTVEAGEEVPHRIIFTVTDLTKVINGVNTVVIYDRDFSDGTLEEAELAFFAQDIEGNVWHLGQYRETYDPVEFVGGRAWMMGHLDGALAGIMMKATPEVDSSDYSQGYAPFPFNWTDRARTYLMGETVTIELGTYENVLVSEEFNFEEPGAFQLKYYAPTVGNIQIGWHGDDTQQEEMDLVEIVELDAEALADIREQAMVLEMHAYVYPDTLPATQRAD